MWIKQKKKKDSTLLTIYWKRVCDHTPEMKFNEISANISSINSQLPTSSMLFFVYLNQQNSLYEKIDKWPNNETKIKKKWFRILKTNPIWCADRSLFFICYFSWFKFFGISLCNARTRKQWIKRNQSRFNANIAFLSKFSLKEKK